MNGTTLRLAGTAACVLALVAPASALAKKSRVHKATSSGPTIIVQVPHDYDAGGNGAPVGLAPGQKLNLFDPVQVAVALGNNVLSQLSLPPVQVPNL
jgi:hypothetical protein